MNMAFIGAEDISEFDITHTGDILHQHGKKLFQCDKALAKYCEQTVHHMRQSTHRGKTDETSQCDKTSSHNSNLITHMDN